jgi:hypothetical protein
MESRQLGRAFALAAIVGTAGMLSPDGQSMVVGLIARCPAEHRDAANATMIDSDNVLLLRPARPGPSSSMAYAGDSSPRSTTSPSPPGDGEIERLDRELGPAWTIFVTEESANNFPRLLVREGEHVVARFSGRADPRADEILRLQT